MKYRFILETYSGITSRYRCPECNKRTVFSRYIDTEKGEYLGEKVGRCNRELKCGYHYTPKQFFENTDEVNITSLKTNLKISKPKIIPSVIHTIPKRILEKSIDPDYVNNFLLYLRNIFDPITIQGLIKTYHIGTSKLWRGATVFWQVDRNKNIRSGKIMLYNSYTGKRIKKPFPHISWVHKALALDNYNLKQCFFGEDLIAIYKQKPIAMVESEKTAIIASVYLPDFIWIATGSLSNLSYEKTKVLRNRQVILFPDLGAYPIWKDKIDTLYPDIDYQISDLLENHATQKQQEEGWDIADYLIALNR